MKPTITLHLKIIAGSITEIKIMAISAFLLSLLFASNTAVIIKMNS